MSSYEALAGTYDALTGDVVQFDGLELTVSYEN